MVIPYSTSRLTIELVHGAFDIAVDHPLGRVRDLVEQPVQLTELLVRVLFQNVIHRRNLKPQLARMADPDADSMVAQALGAEMLVDRFEAIMSARAAAGLDPER